MTDLTIHVILPDAPERAYRFTAMPVLVGRSATCHLSVRHGAMPRELCRLWLEDDGRRVRVEERSGLTNPLLRDGLPVRGGASGPRLSLAVGPVRLRAEPARYREAARTTGHGRRLLAALGAVTVVAGLACLLGSARRATGEPGMPRLPGSPLPGDAGETGPDDGRPAAARAALLESRAAELLSGPDASPADRVEALLALRRAADLLPEQDAAPLAHRARELERTLLAGYREQSLALERALARGDRSAASRAATNLLSHLAHHEDDAARARLAAVAGLNP
ncbi:MAG TPA: FHA domain-containing protein [Polyangia bacterium]|nr:FHA domain-containing protein [Polyangia bacterium]